MPGFHLSSPSLLAILHITALLLPLDTAKAPWNHVIVSPAQTIGMYPTPATEWIQPRLSALYDPAVAQDVFDSTFSPACEVRANHVMQPLHAFRDALVARTPQVGASVAWEDVVADRSEEPVVVAGALVVTRTLPFRVRAGPAQRVTYVHFSARIEQDTGVQDGDRRRITSFYYTSVDKTPPIHFGMPREAQEKIGVSY